MSKSISLFSGYNQKENRTTNYCLLILKMLYEENPKYLSDVVSKLTDETVGNLIGVKFAQQKKQQSSTPDGLITQRSFTVYIETKNFDWFYDSQLENHLAELNKNNSEYKILFALGNFETDTKKRFQHIEQLCQSHYKSSIFFKAITFDEFAEALRIEHLSKNLADAVEDFKGYLDEQRLLQTWKDTMDVINCAGLPDDILVGQVYMCPAEGGSYSHRRCKYFGMYREKKVDKVAIIEAVVDVESDTSAELRWKNIEGDDKWFIRRAKEKIKQLRPNAYPTRVFLLGQLYDTNFQKDTSGGMLPSKTYFDVSPLRVADAVELADKLRDKTWSNYTK